MKPTIPHERTDDADVAYLQAQESEADDLALRVNRLEAENARLRALLWEHHEHRTGRYGDDGELQCVSCRPYLDFKRAPIEEIERAFDQDALRRSATQSPSPDVRHT